MDRADRALRMIEEADRGRVHGRREDRVVTWIEPTARSVDETDRSLVSAGREGLIGLHVMEQTAASADVDRTMIEEADRGRVHGRREERVELYVDRADRALRR